MSFFVAKKIHCTFVYALHWMPRYTYAIRMSCEKVNATLHDTILKALRLRECVYLGSGASKWRKHKCLWLDSFSAPSELSENGFCKLFYVIITGYTHTLHIVAFCHPSVCQIYASLFQFGFSSSCQFHWQHILGFNFEMPFRYENVCIFFFQFVT